MWEVHGKTQLLHETFLIFPSHNDFSSKLLEQFLNLNITDILVQVMFV